MLENLFGGYIPPSVVSGTQISKLLPSDLVANDYFGNSVAISSDGSFCFVGAESDDDRGSNAGCVYFYKFNGSNWVLVTKLLPSIKSGDSYGWSMALSGDDSTLIVGARGDDTIQNAAGAAYIFKNTSGDVWSNVAKLTDATAHGTDFLGQSVSLSYDGKTAIVGAQTAGSTFGSSTGSAVVFKNTIGNTWSRSSKLTAEGLTADDSFGASVSLSSDGTIAVIGATGNQSAFVFKNTIGNSWTQLAKLKPTTTSYAYGSSVAISGDGNTCLVGGGYQPNGGEVSVFSYVEDAWEHTYTIKALTVSNRFGNSVSMTTDGQHCLIGASNTVGRVTNTGAAFAFRKNGVVWEQVAQLIAVDGNSSDNFGSSVSISNDGSTCLVGAYWSDAKGNNSGAAYIFK